MLTSGVPRTSRTATSAPCESSVVFPHPPPSATNVAALNEHNEALITPGLWQRERYPSARSPVPRTLSHAPSTRLAMDRRGPGVGRFFCRTPRRDPASHPVCLPRRSSVLDSIRDDSAVPEYLEPRTEYYCGNCHGYLRSGPWTGDVLVWITCDRCTERRREREAEEEQRRELWQERLCAAADCGTAFMPRQSEQRFCSDRCRKRSHRWAKAHASGSNGAAPATRP
jgi:hypothetical protein